MKMPMKKEDIMSMAQNNKKWMDFIGAKEIESFSVGIKKFSYDTPFFSGILCIIQSNIYFANMIAVNALEGKSKEQYLKLEAKYKKDGKHFSYFDFNYALYDEYEKI